MAEDLYYRFTRKEYDSVRLLESVTDCNGLGIRFDYTKEGLLRSITDKRGSPPEGGARHEKRTHP
ncbi:hypothetical protein NXU84_12980 [Parabacteroides distasonis]|nr:hypothetical protein [Parabacteroides distasonis]